MRRSHRGLAMAGGGSSAGAAVGWLPAGGEARMPCGAGVEASADVAEGAAVALTGAGDTGAGDRGAGDTGAATAVDGVAALTASATSMPGAANWNLI
jgi:hypothetical protein